ncbi:hypothetical protein NPIL_300381 [Nephila pilipes]|uniref:C2H2-type domain-containing protein n=1 Tax=Nephila pilipes TaxID=299642 RepID=A0A8X6P2Q1_NEPPI|nr:hypothetical protein NPIL_300381 [Nephila pilipes]
MPAFFISMSDSSDTINNLCIIDYPLPKSFTCNICFNPAAPTKSRRIGHFSDRGGYVRHLRNAHGIDTASRVTFKCVSCGHSDRLLKKLARHKCRASNIFARPTPRGEDLITGGTPSTISPSRIPTRDGRRILARSPPAQSATINNSDKTEIPPNINSEFPPSSIICRNISTENEAGPATCGAPLVNDSLNDFIIKSYPSVAPVLSESEQPRSDLDLEVPFAPTLTSTRVPPAIDLDRVVDPSPVLPEPLVGSSICSSIQDLAAQVLPSPGSVYDPLMDPVERDYIDIISLVDDFDGSRVLHLRPERRWSGGCFSSPISRPTPVFHSCPNIPPGFLSPVGSFCAQDEGPVFHSVAASTPIVDRVSSGPMAETPVPFSIPLDIGAEPARGPFPSLLSFALGTLKGSATLFDLFGAVAIRSQFAPSAADPPSISTEDCPPLSSPLVEDPLPPLCPPVVSPKAPRVAPIVIRTPCPYCEKPFKTQKGLNSHMVVRHNGFGGVVEICETAPPEISTLRVASSPSAEASVPVLKTPKAKRVRFDLPEPCPGPSLQSKGSSSSPSSGGDSTEPTGDSKVPSVPGVVGPVPVFLTKFQKDWLNSIKVVGSAGELDEVYSQFILSLGGNPSRRRSRPRNPARRNGNSRRHQPSAE